MSYIKVKRQCFQDVFVHYHFFNIFLIRVVGAVGNNKDLQSQFCSSNYTELNYQQNVAAVRSRRV